MRLPIYLDYMSTTPVDSAVRDEMLRYLTHEGHFGNPSSRTHIYGWYAEQAIKLATQRLAKLIEADERTIIWTSGATESINLALKGCAWAYFRQGNHLITAETEHSAVLQTCRYLERNGYEVTYLKPRLNGLIDLEQLRLAIKPETILVSVAHVNNEIGVIEDIAAIGQIVQQHGILLHVDAAQSLDKLNINLQTLPVDLMSFSGHKVYAPKGIGALYIRTHLQSALVPLIHGGKQQHGIRSGTLPTHQIASMGVACQLISQNMKQEQSRIRQLRDQLWEQLQSLEGIHLNGSLTERVVNNLNVSISGVDGESLLLSLKDLALSSGSSCNSANTAPSHVLRAIGRDINLANSTLRISLGRLTTQKDIDYAGQLLIDKITQLRKMSPLWSYTSDV